MVALDYVKQIQAIEKRASIGLQAISSGEDSEQLLTSLIAVVIGIYVEIHDCDLSEVDQIAAYGELTEQVLEDRMNNVKVFFDCALP